MPWVPIINPQMAPGISLILRLVCLMYIMKLFLTSVSTKAINPKPAADFESAKKTCEEENATVGLPEEPEHTLHVPVWINLEKKVKKSWKADGGLNLSK